MAHIDYDRVAIVDNPSVSALYEDALVYETGSAITSSGALTAYSGSKTGRSPLDKRVVKEEGSEKDVWWGPVNKPMSPEVSLVILFVPVSLPLCVCVRVCSKKSWNMCRNLHGVLWPLLVHPRHGWNFDDPFPAMHDHALGCMCATDGRKHQFVGRNVVQPRVAWKCL